MHPPPPYNMGPESKPYDRKMADARSVADSVRGILRFKKAQESTPDPTGKCHLLELTPELRTRIWQMVLQGNGMAIHADMQHCWTEIELGARLNLVMTCSQVEDETATMFLPNNTFVFTARDDLVHDKVLESLADWLNWIPDRELGTIGRVVVCSSQPQGCIEYALTQTGYMKMDSGFVVGDRIDKRVGEPSRNRYGLQEWKYESWGKEHGHFCDKKHFEMVYPLAEAKKKAAALVKEEVEKRAYVLQK